MQLFAFPHFRRRAARRVLAHRVLDALTFAAFVVFLNARASAQPENGAPDVAFDDSALATPTPKSRPTPKTVSMPKSTLKPTPKPLVTATPVATPFATPVPTPIAASAQAYVVAKPGAVVSYGNTLVPASFLSNGLGASVGQVAPKRFRLIYFGHEAAFFPYQKGAIFDGRQVVLPTAPQIVRGELYLPLVPVLRWLGIGWTRVSPLSRPGKVEAETTFLLQFPTAYIENARWETRPERTRVVLTLSNATRITASQSGVDTQFFLAAARRAGVPSLLPIGDYLVPSVLLQSGNGRANFRARTNYEAPVRWFTAGNPARLVIDFERLFQQSSTRKLDGGLALTQIRKGTPHGPVQMFLARIDPNQGWRLRVSPAGFNVLQRARPSRLARSRRALIGVNGGFFANNGAAVGAVLVDGEWLRLPWKARTAIAFRPDGSARIGNLQARATVSFSSGLELPVRELNGWPNGEEITVLTRRFGGYYKLRAGEMAVVVRQNVVQSKPGSGGVAIPSDGFTILASGAARPWLDRVARGERAQLSVVAPGWEGFTHALGGGPRLVNNGKIDVTDIRENFREDVRIGLGPRTALGIDREGRYILLVVDGRQGFYSNGLTLRELAATMRSLGAVDALNLDGGGSTAMSVRGNVINRPSDGEERPVSTVLLVTR